MLIGMGKLQHLIGASFALALATGFSCQLAAQRPSKPAKTWMDLAVGTDLTWTAQGADKSIGGIGSSKSNNAKHEIRVACLGVSDDGRLRIAIVDEALPDEPHETAIVNGEIVLLDPKTSQLERIANNRAVPIQWSPLMAFPYPPVTSTEWKAKKSAAKEIVAPIGGEPQLLPMSLKFGKAKVGKKKVRAIIGEIDPKTPAAIKLVGIAGMVAMSQGRMPKLGTSGVEPIDATVTELRREFCVDAKGRMLAINTTSKFEAADGAMKFEGTHTMTETKRRKLKGKTHKSFAAMMEEICAITQSNEDKAVRRDRAKALQATAKKLGLGPMVERLVDSLTRSGLPAGLGR